MKHDVFFKNGSIEKNDELDENYNEDEIEEVQGYDIKDFQDIMIHDYLTCSKRNSESNNTKLQKSCKPYILCVV